MVTPEASTSMVPWTTSESSTVPFRNTRSRPGASQTHPGPLRSFPGTAGSAVPALGPVFVASGYPHPDGRSAQFRRGPDGVGEGVAAGVGVEDGPVVGDVVGAGPGVAAPPRPRPEDGSGPAARAAITTSAAAPVPRSRVRRLATPPIRTPFRCLLNLDGVPHREPPGGGGEPDQQEEQAGGHREGQGVEEGEAGGSGRDGGGDRGTGGGRSLRRRPLSQPEGG